MVLGASGLVSVAAGLVPVASGLVELLVIRHARPVRDEAPEGGSADPDLADLGLRQAEATADHLADEGIDHIVSSSMKRAVPLKARSPIFKPI